MATNEYQKQIRHSPDAEFGYEDVPRFLKKVSGRHVPQQRLKAIYDYARSNGKTGIACTMDEGQWFLHVKLGEMEILCVGVFMEQQLNLVHEVTEQMRESKDQMQQIFNEFKAVSTALMPLLKEEIEKIRDVRMTVTAEMRQAGDALRDVRKFFFERDYDIEMERLERFIHACQEIKKLKEDGTFDAICDSSIRLSLQEPKK